MSFIFVQRFHKYFGYFILGFGWFSCAFGFNFWVKRYGYTQADFGYVFIPTFFVPVILAITNKVIQGRREKTVRDYEPAGTQIISMNMFESQVKAGKMLVILDDMVLDLEPFLVRHPGGAYVFKRNVGRDISKFFYGGYALGDNKPG